ncbi:MAG: restriction endonuclease [Euzebyales bacterium]|nr:restriction endonuclease [Euzebyales bacterium]
MAGTEELLDWLRAVCDAFEFDVVATFRRAGDHGWPLVAVDAEDLERQLAAGGHLLPLPREPASLANVLEVAIVDEFLRQVEGLDGAEAQRGTERGYPDIEVSGEAFGGGHHAVDVKVARLASGGNRTQSRVTLYTGNTYFRYPQLHWPGTFRPFRDYDSHLDIVAVYRLDTDTRARVRDLELIVHEAWRIASRQRSSTTREYLGAVQSVANLRAGNGEFATAKEFYDFWRRYPFRIGQAAQRQLDRLLGEQDQQE